MSPEPDEGRTRARLLAAAVCCGVAFIAVAAVVASGWSRLAELDLRWSTQAYAFTLEHRGLEGAARVLTFLANGWTVAAVTGAVAVILAVRRRWLLASWLVVTVTGSALLSTALKQGLGRLRPGSAGELTSAHGFAFPSGHTQAATVTYVSIVLVVGWQVVHPGRGARLASAGAVSLVIGGVGLSRVLLGAHWPSDVLGGWLSGSTWVLGATFVLLGLASPGRAQDQAERAVTRT